MREQWHYEKYVSFQEQWHFEKYISFHVGGIVGSAIMVGGFISAGPWGWIADKYGRKPVIMSGTASM